MRETTVTLMLGLGLIGIGAAMAWSVALALLQDAAIAAGALPEPGTRVPNDLYKTNPIWDAATTLQNLANASGVIGAALLIGYAYLNTDGLEVSSS